MSIIKTTPYYAETTHMNIDELKTQRNDLQQATTKLILEGKPYGEEMDKLHSLDQEINAAEINQLGLKKEKIEKEISFLRTQIIQILSDQDTDFKKTISNRDALKEIQEKIKTLEEEKNNPKETTATETTATETPLPDKDTLTHYIKNIVFNRISWDVPLIEDIHNMNQKQLSFFYTEVIKKIYPKEFNPQYYNHSYDISNPRQAEKKRREVLNNDTTKNRIREDKEEISRIAELAKQIEI